MNKKGFVGLAVLIVCIVSLIMSGRGVVSDVDINALVSKLSETVDSHTKEIANLKLEIEELKKAKIADLVSAKAMLKTASSDNIVNKIETKLQGKTVYNPVPGQVVYFNADHDKFHFWDGCQWFGYGEETNLTTAQIEGSKPCMLCQMHKVIKQK